VISLSMGLSSAQVMNPALGTQSNVLEQFEVALATLFFLAINGHHVLLTALSESFATLPLSLQGFQTQVFSQFGTVVHDVMVAGVQIAAPVMVSILCVNVIMGIVGRAVPQINVLITSLPVNILAGFMVLIISVPLFMDSMSGVANRMFEHLFAIMREI
jgi:flagellar biosynthetic protein FliR